MKKLIIALTLSVDPLAILLFVISHCQPNIDNTLFTNVSGKAITESDLREHVRFLASDEFGGRKPFTFYNSALDNASGTAVLLEIADAFSQLPEAPERTVIFLKNC